MLRLVDYFFDMLIQVSQFGIMFITRFAYFQARHTCATCTSEIYLPQPNMLALRDAGSADWVSSVDEESFWERGNNCKRGRFSGKKQNEARAFELLPVCCLVTWWHGVGIEII